MLACAEFSKRGGEAVPFKTLECGRTLAQSHSHFCGQSRRWRACQPFSGQADRDIPPAVNGLVRKVKIDLQPVGLDALDPERFMERGSSNLEVGVPYSCGILAFCRDCEGVESVLGVSVDLLCVELSLRRVQLHHCRMVVGDPVLFVFQDHRDVQSVSRPPDSSLPVDEGFKPLFQNLAPDIKPAEGFLSALGYFQVACRSAPLGHHHKRLSGKLQLCHSVSACLGIADFLELVAVDVKLGVEHRRCVDDVAYADPKLVPSGVLHYHTQI